jgi:hypothetical protein
VRQRNYTHGVEDGTSDEALVNEGLVNEDMVGLVLLFVEVGEAFIARLQRAK